MNGARIFQLFACCLPVQGARRSVICDLQRQSFRFIPNGLYEILTEQRGRTVDEIKEAYEREYDQEIDEYFRFLIDHELGFWSDEPERFPPLDLAWQAPERITNAVLDIDAGSAHDVSSLLRQLDDLGCKALEIRFFNPCSLEEVREVLAGTRHGRLRSIELLVPHGETLTDDALDRLCAEHPRLAGVVVTSAPESRRRKARSGTATVQHRIDHVDSPSCCGQVHPAYFVTNIGHFTEAQELNTCLNRKISIDARGEIKNCPSMERSFGNAAETSLHGALAHRDFRGLWSINKDQIEICKDCEFRYVCTDCRAYLSDPKDLYSKPSKCAYDPYEAQWKKE